MSDPPPGEVAFNLSRGHYYGHVAIAVSALAIFLVFVATISAPYLALWLLIVALVALVPGLVSALQTLSLRDPVLLIDAQGIFDKRVTRGVVPWGKIKRIERAPMFWPCVRLDVGDRRLAGIALNARTHFAVFRQGIVGWDDVVINTQGLARPDHKSHAELADEIAAHAEAMRARFGQTVAKV